MIRWGMSLEKMKWKIRSQISMIKWIMTVMIIIKITRDKIINKTQRAQLKMISMKVNNFNLKCLKILMNSNKRLKINL